MGVLEDDRRRMSAKLRGRAFHVGTGKRGKPLADRCRAGERNLPDRRVRDQKGRNRNASIARKRRQGMRSGAHALPFHRQRSTGMLEIAH